MEKQGVIKRAVVGILAHVDAGKTTLNEALLFREGAVRTLGSVNEKNSHLDHHTLERQRGITIYAKQARIVHEDAELILLDTPGHVDFSSEVERTLPVLDYALIVIDANDGVRGHTVTLWRLLERYNVPTIVFVNKMDSTLRSRDEIIRELSQRLSNACIDFSDFGAATQQKQHDNMEIVAQLAEACAAEDESALEEYFEKETLSLATVQRLVTERTVYPCFFGSALKQEGVDELVDALACFVQVRHHSDDFGARVFKVSHDPSGSRLTWLKVTDGTLKVRQPVEQPDETGHATAALQKVDQIRFYTGGRFETSTLAEAGQVCAVTGLDHTHPGMALGSARSSAQNSAANVDRPLLVPAFCSSIILNGNDVHRVHAALTQLTDEDPLLNVRWDDRLQELQIQLMGAVQLEIVRDTLRERFDIDIDFGPSGVLYRETIESAVTGIGHFEPLRHYAEVHLLLEPLSPGEGVQFGTCCHVDELDLNWQRLILTNAMEREHIGVLVGAPITDMRITLIGGRAHNKHTEGGDFRQATYRAIRQGLMQAHSILLEPWYRFELRVPEDLVGRALSDLQRMSARFQAPIMKSGDACIEGTVPAKEIRDYAIQLGSYAHGEGSLALEFHAYEPCHDAETVIDEAGYDPEADTANPPDSVFCEHGAGRTVKWDEVAQAAHVKSDPNTFTSWREATPQFFGK